MRRRQGENEECKGARVGVGGAQLIRMQMTDTGKALVERYLLSLDFAPGLGEPRRFFFKVANLRGACDRRVDSFTLINARYNHFKLTYKLVSCFRTSARYKITSLTIPIFIKIKI